jgi:hypothetical protein
MTSARDAPIINGFPPLAKMERTKKKVPIYSAKYEINVALIF